MLHCEDDNIVIEFERLTNKGTTIIVIVLRVGCESLILVAIGVCSIYMIKLACTQHGLSDISN